jgi:chromate reductase
MRVSALCGSLRNGSYNQALLIAAIARGRAHGLEIVQGDISSFPLFSQDLETTGYPSQVDEVKRLVRSSECLLLVTPEHNYGVPGVLKNAIDLLSRPNGDPTLHGRRLALMGASTGRYGTVRAQMAWRQVWHFFKGPTFEGAELAIAGARDAFDSEGRLVGEVHAAALETYLETLAEWLKAECR